MTDAERIAELERQVHELRARLQKLASPSWMSEEEEEFYEQVESGSR